MLPVALENRSCATPSPSERSAAGQTTPLRPVSSLDLEDLALNAPFAM